MALFSKVGSILKQSIAQNSASSMMNSVRYMSSKLYVGGLSYDTNEQTLREAFSEFGSVADAKIIMDRETCRSRGFGFVEYENSESVSGAVFGMDGRELDGPTIRVSVANERPPRGGGGGDYGGGGGYGGGDGGSGGYGSFKLEPS